MKINPQKFAWLVDNVDPTPFYSDIMNASIDPAQAAAHPEVGYAEMLQQQGQAGAAAAQPQAPGGAALPPGMLQQMMGGQGAPVASAPAVAPPRAGPMNLGVPPPPMNIPRGLQAVPNLQQLLKRGS